MSVSQNFRWLFFNHGEYFDAIKRGRLSPYQNGFVALQVLEDNEWKNIPIVRFCDTKCCEYQQDADEEKIGLDI